MLGNAKFIKHSSIIPQCAIAIGKLFLELRAPIVLYTNLLVSVRRASELVFDIRLKCISLTGCEVAGASTKTKADKYFKKNILKLGGSDTFIVFYDVDTNKASKWAVVSRINNNNNGECCIAIKRFIVVENIDDEFF